MCLHVTVSIYSQSFQYSQLYPEANKNQFKQLEFLRLLTDFLLPFRIQFSCHTQFYNFCVYILVCFLLFFENVKSLNVSENVNSFFYAKKSDRVWEKARNVNISLRDEYKEGKLWLWLFIKHSKNLSLMALVQ